MRQQQQKSKWVAIHITWANQQNGSHNNFLVQLSWGNQQNSSEQPYKYSCESSNRYQADFSVHVHFMIN